MWQSTSVLIDNRYDPQTRPETSFYLHMCTQNVTWHHCVFSHILEKFGDNPCSSLMVLCTRGVHTGRDETLMPPLGRVESSEEVLTRTCTVSKGGMTPRLTTSTVLSRSSSITMCPAAEDEYTSICLKIKSKEVSLNHLFMSDDSLISCFIKNSAVSLTGHFCVSTHCTQI